MKRRVIESIWQSFTVFICTHTHTHHHVLFLTQGLHCNRKKNIRCCKFQNVASSLSQQLKIKQSFPLFSKQTKLHQTYLAFSGVLQSLQKTPCTTHREQTLRHYVHLNASGLFTVRLSVETNRPQPDVQTCHRFALKKSILTRAAQDT